MSEAVILLKNIYFRNRTIFFLIFKILITSGILTLILYQINLTEVIQMLKTSNKLIILSAFILSIANIYLQYLKWKVVCNTILEEFDKREILISLFYGFSAGSFTPARIGEYFGRAIFFKDRTLVQVTTATIIDKFCTLLVVALIGVSLFLYYLMPLAGHSAVLVISFILIYFFIYNKGSVIKNAVKEWLMKFRKNSTLFTQSAFVQKFDRKSGLKLILLSILFYICFISQFALLISAFTNHFAIINYLWAGGLVMFFKTIVPVVTFGDLGLREGASVYFISHFGEPAAAGFNASIILFVINVLFPALIGLIFIIKKKC